MKKAMENANRINSLVSLADKFSQLTNDNGITAIVKKSNHVNRLAGVSAFASEKVSTTNFGLAGLAERDEVDFGN